MDLGDEDEGDDPADDDIIEGEAREVFRPEPDPPSDRGAWPLDDQGRPRTPWANSS
ncbi:hypothetical protein [Phenylobacterium sp. SCN 70-31]|uniref:hypothetical protein n=1 Tax=Phenylobacterium sp. SCN 70-31 TaxID=1660129 RepID=UPI0025D219A6|nr:hypothetical protein [Phenylobacterium sp. SCN 70-31]